MLVGYPSRSGYSGLMFKFYIKNSLNCDTVFWRSLLSLCSLKPDGSFETIFIILVNTDYRIQALIGADNWHEKFDANR